jgi:hypothetical protein
VARFCLLSSSLLLFLFCLLLAPGSEVSESPPPPLYSPSFCFTSFPFDRVLSTRLSLSSGRRDLLRPWMSGGHRVWGLLPVRDSLDYLIFGLVPSKLFLLKSPYHTRITWHLLPWLIRFDFSVVCLAGIKAPNLLLFWTSVAVVALIIFWIVVKICVVWCCCSCDICCCCCCDVVMFVVVFLLYCVAALFVGSCFAALFVGSWVVTNVTFTALYVGFCLPLCRVVGLIV